MNTEWPKGNCPQYYASRDELSIISELLFKGSCLVIPTSMRPEMLQRIHEGHLGVEKFKAMARATLFWPEICSDIHILISSCPVCLKRRYKQPKEPMIIVNDALGPWEKIGVEHFELNGKDILTNYPEIAILASTSAACVITHVKSFFARHGNTRRVISDNEPQFAAYEFKYFANTYGFQHITSSPYYA